MIKRKCSKCGALNDVGAKFCSQCGSELPDDKSQERICKNCGYENSEQAKFCMSCGTPLTSSGVRKHAVSSGKRKKDRFSRVPVTKPLPGRKPANPITFPMVVAALVVLGAVFIYLSSDRNPGIGKLSSSLGQSFEQPTANVALENKVYEIASQFACSCGSCGEESLEKCGCPTAQKERQYIREALQHGHLDEEVIAAVNQTYGHMKPEFQSRLQQ